MHESVELPEPVRLVGLSVHDVLLLVRLTTPAKWLTDVTVTVELAATPVSVVTLVGLALIV